MRHASLVLLVTACSGSQTQIAIDKPPAAGTRAVLAGPLCKPSGSCTCRDEASPGDGGAGVPDAGKKRFEVKLGPVDGELWLTVDKDVLYKSKERATDCFYIDLGSGLHKVTLRASRPSGVQAAVAISELGVTAGSWYKTFRFSCGVPGVCSKDELDEAKADYAAIKAGIHDPCGSVKIKGLSWDTGVSPDQIHPDELVVGLTLDIYQFTPARPSGDTACLAGATSVEQGATPDPPADTP